MFHHELFGVRSPSLYLFGRFGQLLTLGGRGGRKGIGGARGTNSRTGKESVYRPLNLSVIAGEVGISTFSSGNLPKVLGGKNDALLIGGGFDRKENL